jgi:hypothetical protein
MDYHHHHLVSHHRTMMVEAPVNGLEAVDTMEVNSVMMSVIHTLRLTQDDQALAFGFPSFKPSVRMIPRFGR